MSLIKKGQKHLEQDGFSLAEVLVVLLLITVALAATVPVLTKRVSSVGTSINALDCIASGASDILFNTTTGNITIYPDTGSCYAAYYGCQQGKTDICNTLFTFANGGSTSAAQTSALKILRASCDKGGVKACEYFIKRCTDNSANCDNASDQYDLRYYLDLLSTDPAATAGRSYIEEKITSYYDWGMTNLTSEVDTACPDACPGTADKTACIIKCDTSGGEPPPPPEPPAAPSGLTAVAGQTGTDRTVILNWTDNSNNETAFRVFQTIGGGSYSQVGSDLGANTTNCTLNLGSSPTEDTYHYKIRAVNADGTADSNIADVIITAPTPPPTAPSGLTATAGMSGTARTVVLNWTDNSNNETAFKVYQAIGGGSYSQTGSDLAANTVTYTVNLGNYPAENTYHYKVTAVNDAGTTDSNIADIAITVPCLTKGSLCVAYVNESSNDSWSDAPSRCSGKGSGWRVPSNSELHDIYLDQTGLGLSSERHWSADSYGLLKAYYRNPVTDDSGTSYRSTNYAIRCVK